MTQRVISLQQHFERVIWLNPGKVTGWASLGSDMSFSSGQFEFHTLGNDIEAYARFHNNQLALGFEKFVVTPSTEAADTEYSLEVIGMVKWIAYKYNTTLLAPASPADRDDVMKGDKLHRLRWHATDKDRANDAAAHLLAWLLREGRVPMHLAAEVSSV